MTENRTKKPGRPPTPADQHAISIRIEQRHVGMLDEIIRDDAAALFRAGLKAVEQRGRETLKPGDTYHLERRVHLATERRRLLGHIIEWFCEVRAATTVKVVVPCANDDTIRDHEEVASWVEREESRLTASAPDIVKEFFASNELRRLEREDPAELVRLLDRARRASAEDANDSGPSD